MFRKLILASVIVLSCFTSGCAVESAGKLHINHYHSNPLNDSGDKLLFNRSMKGLFMLDIKSGVVEEKVDEKIQVLNYSFDKNCIRYEVLSDNNYSIVRDCEDFEGRGELISEVSSSKGYYEVFGAGNNVLIGGKTPYLSCGDNSFYEFLNSKSEYSNIVSEPKKIYLFDYRNTGDLLVFGHDCNLIKKEHVGKFDSAFIGTSTDKLVIVSSVIDGVSKLFFFDKDLLSKSIIELSIDISRIVPKIYTADSGKSFLVYLDRSTDGHDYYDVLFVTESGGTYLGNSMNVDGDLPVGYSSYVGGYLFIADDLSLTKMEILPKP